MPVQFAVSDNKQEVRVTISGRFDFEMHDQFGPVLESVQKFGNARYIIDRGAVQDIDSSAIGMLLLLRDMAGGNQARVELIRCRPEIKDELSMANLDKMFTIA